MLKLWNKAVAKLVKWLHVNGITKNEVINVNGDRYPIAQFLGFSDEKILDILKTAGVPDDCIEAAFAGINEMRKGRS